MVTYYFIAPLTVKFSAASFIVQRNESNVSYIMQLCLEEIDNKYGNKMKWKNITIHSVVVFSIHEQQNVMNESVALKTSDCDNT